MYRNKLLAAMLALLMLVMPLGALGETEVEPGTLLNTLLSENFENGHEVAAVLGFSVDALPGLTQEQTEAVAQIAQALNIFVTAADRKDAEECYLSVRLQDQEVANALLRVTKDGLEMTTSLTPGKTLVFSWELMEEMSASPVNKVDVTSPEVQTLIETLSNAYVTYFYALANWVSDVQYENEDLYQYTDDYIDETDVRDGVATQMHARVRHTDFRRLIRTLADTFYADEEVQEAIVDAFKNQGATPENVFEAGKSVCLAIAALEPNEGATEFVVSYGDDYEMVGFDGTMPAMWKGFPFDVGTLTYSRKTLDESVRHTAQGHMTLPEGVGSVDGTLAIEKGNLLDTGRTNSYDINLLVTDETEEPQVMTVALSGQDAAYVDDGIDYLEGNLLANFSIADKAGTTSTAYALNLAGKSGAWMEEDEVYSQSFLTLTVQDLLSASLTLDLYSQPYEPVDVSGYERVDVAGLDEAGVTQLESELEAGMMQAAFQFMSLMPQEAMTTLMQAE